MKLTPEQQEVLANEIAEKIHEFLLRRGPQHPATLGQINEAIEQRDVARTNYQLQLLVDVGLVEKVPGTYDYRVVKK